MTAKAVADIIFCLDASLSMKPCFEGVRKQITGLLDGLKSNPQVGWDWRIDFLAHSAVGEEDGFDNEFRGESVHQTDVRELFEGLYRGHGADRFFTDKVGVFKKRLSKVRIVGNEAPLVALDCCLDFPWRQDVQCQRVVIMMMDEPFETGAYQRQQRAKLDALIDKIQRLRVILFMVAPQSAVFDELASADRSVYEVVDRAGDGLGRVDFRELLREIGKSVSVSDLQGAPTESVPGGIFGQASWTKPGGVFSSHVLIQ